MEEGRVKWAEAIGGHAFGLPDRFFLTRRDLVRYVSAAGVDHTRLAHDVTVKRMLKGARIKGRNVARFDAARGIAEPPFAVFRRALRLSAHAVLFRCWSGATHALQAYVYAYHAARAR